MTQAELLAAGIAEMGLSVSSDTQQKLLSYIGLLQKWNKVYNLTAVRDTLEMVTLHLLDSLSVLPYIQAKSLLDVGSGGGLPGIVLAICLPQLKVTTIDAVQKKVIFMRQVKGELGLDNLEVVHARVENYRPAEKFDAIISRAFSELGLFIGLTKHLIKENGQWLAMKGQVLQDELKDLSLGPAQIIPLMVAGLEARRHLVVLENNR
ncbi:MAG TPA: 16S rRNA (guanine(527)-N(7))-methyltransferase RsmG [Methylotenera sp.]|nr:16S rRNA (guanine(527)-N(7))-methyltransferase RsmG [Methylotenera sp.]HPV45602.1 16S rRNA (guanine(527)-N(7))-methyltransferase RsmG [Methylotenera sp.]